MIFNLYRVGIFISPMLINKEAEAPSSYMICPESESSKVAEPGSKTGLRNHLCMTFY